MTQFQCPSCGQTFLLNTTSTEASCPCCGGNKCFIVSNDNIGNNPQQGFHYAHQQQYQQGYNQTNDIFEPGPSGKQRGLAGIFAILLGTLGVHYFYMGKTTAGVIFLLITLLSCGILALAVEVISFIQGILILTMSQEKFESKYIYSHEKLPLF